MTKGPEWGAAMRSGVVWSNASFLATRAISTLSLLVLARILTPGDFGVVAAITVYVGLLELASDLGMKATVVYEQEHGITVRVQNAFTVNALLSLALAVLGFVFAPVIADFFHVGDSTWLFRLAALNPLLRGLGNIHDALLQRDMSFRRRALPEFVNAGIRGLVSVPLALAGLGAQSLVIGLLAGTLAWTVTHWRLTPLRPTFTLDRAIVRSMAAYGGASSALNVISAIGLRVDQVAIGRVLGDTALGLYTVAFRIPELLIESVSWNMSKVAFPGLSRQRMADEQGLAASTRRIVHFQALYALPLSAGIAVLGPPLVVTLFGSKWQAAGGVASAIAVTSGLSAVGFPLGDTFKAVGRQRVLVVLSLIQLPIYVAVIVLVAPAGILAVAWARAGAEVFHLVLVGVMSSRLLSASMKAFAGATGAGTIAGAGVLVGAGAVRLAWPALSLGPLLAGSLAGFVMGVLFLRLFAPGAFGELSAQLTTMRRRLHRTPAGQPS